MRIIFDEKYVALVKVDTYSKMSSLKKIIESYLCIDREKTKKTVLVKPNWILPSRSNSDQWHQVITHPALVTLVIEVLAEKITKGSRIIVADGPDGEADFRMILSRYPINKWQNIAKRYGHKLEIYDLRDELCIKNYGVILKKVKVDNPPFGNFRVNMKGRDSEYFTHRKSTKGYYGTNYDTLETNRAHNGKDNIYYMSKILLEADIVINLPKLKTHRKTGITASLKNVVGLTTNRNYLPHHSEGSYQRGGDQFKNHSLLAYWEGNLLSRSRQISLKSKWFLSLMPTLRKLGERIFGRTTRFTRSGNWYGNDTAWRMVLDINKVIFYFSKSGIMLRRRYRGRKYFTIVDAILVGEGMGPLDPDPVQMGYVIIGTNPVAVDLVCAKIMSFDFKKIPMIAKAFTIKHYRLTNFSPGDVKVVLNGKVLRVCDIPQAIIKRIKPQFGWQGHIEDY